MSLNTAEVMRLDRRVSRDLMSALSRDGSLRSLVESRGDRRLLDLQLRKEPWGSTSWATLYAGLTGVLSVRERNGAFWLDAADSHKSAGGFAAEWASPLPLKDLTPMWSAVETYVRRVIETLPDRHFAAEGVVHAALCSGRSDDYRVIDREASPAFRDTATRDGVCAEIGTPLREAVAGAGRTEAWWPSNRNHGVMPNLGWSPDVIAVGEDGRLLVIEAKPAGALEGIAWGPVQVRFYAELFARLLREQHDLVAVLNDMLAQRVALGLTPSAEGLQTPLTIVPVLAIGAGIPSPEAEERFNQVRKVIDAVPSTDGIGSVELWWLDDDGHIVEAAVAAPDRRRSVSFREAARRAAVVWKQSTSTLPDTARGPGPYRPDGPAYGFCLPSEFLALNLLPEAREIALDRFDRVGIPWHAGGNALPGPHLLSSQVQCANALAPFVDSPDALAAIFGGVLPIADVLPFGDPALPTDHVVFEWIGLTDHLGERGGSAGIRGAHSTSADAAIKYRNTDGQTEIALIEWKYIERYGGGPLSGGEASLAKRQRRYRSMFADPDGPLRNDLVAFDDLFVEPFYQLMRQQLLAYAMEHSHELGADRVRVIYAAPAANAELWGSLGARHRQPRQDTGPTFTSVLEVWTAMQRRPDRFSWFDTAALVADDAPTSAEFKARYGHLRATPPSLVEQPPPADVAAALDLALMTLTRVSGEGSTLEQLASMSDRFAELPLNLAAELAARSDELAELARRLRAGPVHRALDLLGHER